jgi:hypothetical protein
MLALVHLCDDSCYSLVAQLRRINTRPQWSRSSRFRRMYYRFLLDEKVIRRRRFYSCCLFMFFDVERANVQFDDGGVVKSD